MNRISKIALVIFGWIVVSSSAWAQGQFAQEGPTFNRKVRNLGMGNVGIALRGSADSSPFYNPAGLNDIERGRIQFMSISAEAAEDSVGLFGDVKDLTDDLDDPANSSGTCKTTYTDPDAQKACILSKFVGERAGQFQYVRFTLDLFNYARKNFAAGVSVEEKLDASFRGTTPTEFDMKSLGDVVAYFAGAHDFWEKALQVGVTMRPTIRFAMDEADQHISLSDVVSDPAPIEDQIKNIKDPRFGLAIDLGLKSNLAFGGFEKTRAYEILKPAIGFTWQDVGDPSFGTAPSSEQSLNVGLAIHPDVWILKNAVALDFRELNQDREFLTKLHFGAETVFDWIVDFGLRVGVSQGYMSGGVTIDLKYFKIDGAIYSEEVGINTREYGSVRWAANISFNI